MGQNVNYVFLFLAIRQYRGNQIHIWSLDGNFRGLDKRHLVIIWMGLFYLHLSMLNEMILNQPFYSFLCKLFEREQEKEVVVEDTLF